MTASVPSYGLSVAPQLAEFNRRLDALTRVENAFLSKVLSYVFAKRGKQLRPLLTLLSAQACLPGAPVPEEALLSALALEVLHTATLQHDDVVDESDLRRAQPSTNAAFGNKVAVLVGDYLLARAVDFAARTHSGPIVSAVSEVGAWLAEGELLQLQQVGSDRFDEQLYMHIIECKTAHLFCVCARCGALAAGASDEQRQALESFALHFGLAFQIHDDLLDCTATAAQVGKPVGNDLREHKLTLPLACGVPYARQQVDHHLLSARQALAPLPPSAAKQSLLTLLTLLR